jgi:hypothetical protein
MAIEPKKGIRDEGTLRKLLVPAAMGIGGSALAVVLTKKPKQLTEQLTDAVPKVREAMPQLPERGIGEITGDLRNRLDAVLGKEPGGGADDEWEQMQPSDIDTSKFEERRAARRERRDARRRRRANR